MLDELEDTLSETETEECEMPSFNHSFICNRLLQQLFTNDQIEALPELTLNIEKDITPDISIYPKEKVAPDFLNDYAKYPDLPILAIEIISASQNIQDLLEKSKVWSNARSKPSGRLSRSPTRFLSRR
jgi:Uma2 family endonuclease